MIKKIPDPIGKCPVCTINLYGDIVTSKVETPKGVFVAITGTPLKMPCGVGLERPPVGTKGLKAELIGTCPFETVAEQERLKIFTEEENIAGQMGTMHTND